MCRLLSISGKIKYSEILVITKKFRQLAENGNIPIGTSKGHKDGWGFVAYEKGKPVLFARSPKDAFIDAQYLHAVGRLKNKKPNIVIGHLRKAFVGAKNISNAQPFRQGKYSFCHNGTVLASEKISLKNKFKKIIKGGTDSEKFFAFLLQLLAEHKKPNSRIIRGSIKKAVNYMRKNLDFTALNIVFSDGKCVWVLREVNEKNSTVIEKRLVNYYSLYIGKGKLYSVASSEKLTLKNVKWKAMKNHELIEINLRDNKISRC